MRIQEASDARIELGKSVACPHPDAGQIGRLSRLRQHEGVDYTSEEYRDAVRRTVARIHPPTMHLRVSEIMQETPSASTLRFNRLDGELPPWRAGQYVTLSVQVAGTHAWRPYSVSSPPGAGFIDLTICRRAGGLVSERLLSSVRPGDEFTACGPFGTLCIEPLIDRGPVALLAGGCGIAPLMSMIREDYARRWPRQLHVIYGSRKLADVIFRGELDRLSAGNPRLNYALVLSDPEPGYQGDWWVSKVRTEGSASKISCVPLPWWTSQSTMRTLPTLCLRWA
jgi:ferredoxin-NADP reductase